MPLEREKIKKTIISTFVVLNIFAVILLNRPPEFIDYINKKIINLNHPKLAAKLDYYSWLVYQYAHIVGLDNRWKMFGKQSRFNWWYLIYGKYEESEKILLPLPPQMPRTFVEDLFIDFKEIKFYLNMYLDQNARETYARYLCRKYPEHNGLPIQSIIYDLYYQGILPPQEARLKGSYIDPHVYNYQLNEFVCPGKNK